MGFEQLFDASYERARRATKRISGREQCFFEAFYERFVQSSPKVAELFKHTDMGLQKKVLEKSFYRLMVFYATNAADDYLEHIAIRHSKTHLNIAPVLYDLWLESLVETLKTFDPDFNREVELAWRLVLAPGIAYMKFYYDH